MRREILENRFSWIRGKPDSFMHVSSEPNSAEIIKPNIVNRHAVVITNY